MMLKLIPDQSVLGNEGKVSWSRKQREPLMGLDLTSDLS